MNLGKQLHALGRFGYRHPWRIIGTWIIILASCGYLASHFYKAPSSDISIPGTKAQQAIDHVEALFPEDGGASGRIVFHAKHGSIRDYRSEIVSVVKEVKGVDGISDAVSPFIDNSFVSKDERIAYSPVQLDEQTGKVKEETLDTVAAITAAASKNNLQVEIGGGLVSSAPGEIIGLGEIAGVVIALMVLIITLGSLISGGMPIISAVTAVGVSMAGLFTLSQVFEITSTTPVLAVMLGLAVGIDYALFIVNKYRSLVLAGYSLQAAVARSLGTAGNAVVFAAITVIIALAALSVVQIPFMTTMGLVGAASIAVAAVVSLTLVPALLGLAKHRMFTKKQRQRIERKSSKPKHSAIDHRSFWFKWGKVVTARPIGILLVSILIVGVVALPVRELSLGLPTDQYAAKDSTQRKAYDLLTEGFGVGFNAPLTVVVDGMPKVSAKEEAKIRKPAMKQYNREVAKATKKQTALFNQQLTQATTPEQLLALQQAALLAQKKGETQKKEALAEIEKNVKKYAKYVRLNAIADNIKKLDNVEKVQPALVKKQGTAGIIQVIPKTAPADSNTKDLIFALRDEKTQKTLVDSSNVSIGVTGATVLQDDINQKLAEALPMYLSVIVGLSFLLLLLAFRSVLVPVKATLGYVLSVLAMFGAIVAVFQWGWLGITDSAGPIVSFVPIIGAGILFGLAMDYEFFLVSGMHESYQHGTDAKKSVVEGFGAGAKVVTAAAIIMISVFAGFMTNHETVIQSIGFGLAIGILVDAFIVRMTIVPAVMTLLGNSAWWLPKWLDKLLPHISIEGETEK